MVGGGDSALEEAMFLTKFANKVTVIHRRDSLRASKIMQERAIANDKIEFLWNHVVDRSGRRRSAHRDHGPRRGERARTPTLACQASSSPSGTARTRTCSRASSTWTTTVTCVTSPGSTHTNVDGVFACGDVQDHTYRQAVTAAGSGCMAAIDAERWLEATRRLSRRHPPHSHME